MDVLGLWEAVRKSLSPLEMWAAAVSLVNVYLTVRNNIWNWAWGFVAVILYGIVFWNFKLYGQAWLQIIYFLPIQFVGWYVWLRKGPKKDDDLPIARLTGAGRAGWLGVTGLLTVPIVAYLRYRTNDPAAFADGLTTAMSIVAQYLQVHKRFENWILWITADVIYVYLFYTQKLYVTSALYAIFTVLATLGALSWLKIMRAQQTASVVGTTEGTQAA